MNWYNTCSKLVNTSASVALMFLCSACSTFSSPPAVNTNVTINFPPTERVVSVEQADAVLELVTLSRDQINWRYRQKEQICYDKFFVNNCLLEAKDERRVDLARVKKSEVEANYFKRKDNVEQMDKALEERNADHSLSDLDKADPDKTDADKQDPATMPPPTEGK
jgi:hypothetical protein